MNFFPKAGSVFLWLSVVLLCSCNKPGKDGPQPPDADEDSATSCVYVLCEGLYGMNNSRLFAWNVRTGVQVPDRFSETNKRGLGDTGNDLLLYGGKMYVVMNGSNTIEVADIHTAASIKQIPLVDERGVGRQPRSACAAEGKVYVCSFDGSLCRIDTNLLEVEALLQVGRNPDGICTAAGKLYISNSGGLDYPDCDSTVSVVDMASFTETKRIAVGLNPYTIAADSRNYVYVCTRGDYDGYSQKNGKSGEPYNFYRIDPSKDSVDRIFNIPVMNFCLNGDTAYLYNYDYNTNTSWIGVFDLNTESLVREDFICDGTRIQKPYSIAVDPNTGLVYIGEAYNHLVSGSLFVFSKDGRLQATLPGIGLNPSCIRFI